MSRSITISSAVVLLAVAGLLVWNPVAKEQEIDAQPPPRESGPTPPTRSVSESSGIGRASGQSRAQEVIRLSPTDWKRLFASDYRHVSEQDQTEILELAAELDHALSTGGRPDSDDARVYVDAILSLLRESGIE